jgi:catechol 2,3-dioxygenase-like lactoylglutathione lyase family enzyme
MTKKLLVLRVQHAQITIPVGAEAEAREFYCGVLGLKEIPKPEILRPRGGFWLEIGAFQVHVGTEDGFDRRLTKAHIAYEVEDLEAWRARLRENDVEILEGAQIPHYRRFEFRDPFGNRVEFLERIAKIQS